MGGNICYYRYFFITSTSVNPKTARYEDTIYYSTITTLNTV